jgi:intracellular multiplication protein IcmE
MTDRENIDITDQVDELDEASQSRPASEGLKDVWNSNPLLKVAAVVVGIGIFVGAYLTFFDKQEIIETKSVVGGVDRGAAAVAGQTEVDAEYRKALEEANTQRAEQAAKSGGSAMPTPISTAKSENIDLPATNVQEQEDPLREWRARNEQRSATVETVDEGIEDQTAASRPEIVPLVQPVRPQVDQAINPEMAKALADQMRVIVSAQKPDSSTRTQITNETSPYIKMKTEMSSRKAPQSSGGGDISGIEEGLSGGKSNEKVKPKLIVAAGTIAYAQLLNELNSDIKGPVLAQILSGPFEGGRAIGTFDTRDEYLVLSFKRIVKQGVSYGIDGIALNEETTLAAHQTDVDHHYFTRVILPAAAKFIEGYGSAVAETGTSTTTTAGGGVVEEEPEPDTREELFKGVEEASSKLSEIVDEGAERPITVKVSRGTTMGILFMQQVTTENAE